MNYNSNINTLSDFFYSRYFLSLCEFLFTDAITSLNTSSKIATLTVYFFKVRNAYRDIYNFVSRPRRPQ